MNAPDPTTYTLGYAPDAVVARTEHSLVLSADARRTARRVAIKIALDRDGADALRRELQVLRGLRHVHVIELIEGTALGQPWMVTELAAWSLERVIAARGGLAADEVAGVITAIASALQLVHRHRFVHGDVKPSNILLLDDGRPVLADFGAAHPIGAAPARFTPTYFVDDGPHGDVAALARSALAACAHGGDGRLDALRTVLGEFGRVGDRPDALVDAVCSIVAQPRWPKLDTADATDAAAMDEPTVPCGPRPPRSADRAVPPARRASRARRVAAVVVASVLAISAIDVVRDRGHDAANIEQRANDRP
jgi:serine/threonine protein kinase